jgi:hypothetical protein
VTNEKKTTPKKIENGTSCCGSYRIVYRKKTTRARFLSKKTISDFFAPRPGPGSSSTPLAKPQKRAPDDLHPSSDEDEPPPPKPKKKPRVPSAITFGGHVHTDGCCASEGEPALKAIECEPEAEEPAAPKAYPPAKWKKVKDAEGKPKRRCLWEHEDGSICGKEISDQNDKIEEHWRTHTGEMPYVCSRLKENGDVCGKGFAQSGNLKTHVRTVHDKEKNHVCDRLLDSGKVCGKAFGQAEHMRMHQKTVHNKEKPYVCQHEMEDGNPCGKAFGDVSNLSKHQQTVHNQEKRFVCDREMEDGNPCGQAFGQAGDLRKHQRLVHDKQRPHTCKRLLEDETECGQAFGTAQHLHQHEQALHDGELLRPCPGAVGETECPYRLSWKQHYDKLCVRCFVASFPNDPRANKAKKFLHAKELAVREFLEAAFPGYRWVFDRNCSRVVGKIVRPDAKAVLGRTRMLIVEVDEDSHDTYNCANERAREKVIAQHAPRGTVVHLIRFNPDAYDNPKTGRRVPSCFQISKVEGSVKVHPDRVKDWEARLEKLKSTIQEIIDHRHEDIAIPACVLDDDRYKFVIPIELFYDAVREKWPDGNVQRLAAYKRNATVRKQAAA